MKVNFIRKATPDELLPQDVFHCIFVTSKAHNFGILVESEGYHYARYAAFTIKKTLSK